MKKKKLKKIGIEVFGSKKKYKTWLNTPNFVFGGYKPKNFKKKIIRDELGRIEYGILC